MQLHMVQIVQWTCLQYLVKPVCMCCAWHIAPTFCLKPVKNIVHIVTDWARRCWWLPICVVQFSMIFFFFNFFLFLVFFSWILPAIHPHTINQVNGYLNSAWLHHSQLSDRIRRDEEWERKYGWEPEYWDVKHRLKRICKNVHIKLGVHLIAQSFFNFTSNGEKTDRPLWYLTLNICLPLVLFVSNWPPLYCSLKHLRF